MSVMDALVQTDYIKKSFCKYCFKTVVSGTA